MENMTPPPEGLTIFSVKQTVTPQNLPFTSPIGALIWSSADSVLPVVKSLGLVYIDLSSNSRAIEVPVWLLRPI